MADLDHLTFPHDRVALDLLLWRTYRREVPGLVEGTFGLNPGLAELGVFAPRGTAIVETTPAPANTLKVIPLVRLY